MDIDIFEGALQSVLQVQAAQKDLRLLITEYRAELQSRHLSTDELLDAAATSMANAEQDADREKLNVGILNKIIDDYEAREATLAALPWDEIMADLQERIGQMNAEQRDPVLRALAVGMEIRNKRSRNMALETPHSRAGKRSD